MTSRLQVLPKKIKMSMVCLSETLTFRDRTTDVTYCADVTLFLHATPGGLPMTAAFSLRRFLAFYCFKC